MVIEMGDWRACPHPQGNCWQLQKRASKGCKEPWLRPEHFPGTLSRAVEMLVEYAVRDSEGRFDLDQRGGLDRMLRQVDRTVASAVARLRGVAEEDER